MTENVVDNQGRYNKLLIVCHIDGKVYPAKVHVGEYEIREKNTDFEL